MNFFERLGTLAKDLGGAAIAPAKFVWDVGTAPWNDDEQFNGFSNTLKTSGKNLISSYVKPFTSAVDLAMPVFQKIDEINQQVIRRPLTAGLLTLQGAEGGWGRAYEEANKNVSFGQAAASLIGAPFIDDSFNIYDQQQRDEMFKKNMLGKLASGTIDLGINLVGDVTIVGGKAAKAARASQYITDTIKSGDDIERIGKEIYQAIGAVDGAATPNKYNDFAKLMVGADESAARNHPLVKNSAHPELLASAFAVAKDEKTALDVLLVSLADEKAIARLDQKYSDLVQDFKTAQGKTQLMDDYLANPDSFVLSDDLDEFGNLSPDALKNNERWNALYDKQQKILDDTRKNFPQMEAILGISRQAQDEGWLLSRTVGSMQTARGFDKTLMKMRTDASLLAKTAEQNIPKRAVRYFTRNPYAHLIQAVHFATGEKPAGIFNFEDVESSREMIAQADNVLKLADGFRVGKFAKPVVIDEKTGAKVGVSAENGVYKFVDQDGVYREVEGLTSDNARKFVNEYISAASAPERMKVASRFESTAIEAIAAKHGISPDHAKAIYSEVIRNRKSLLKAMNSRGFAIDRDGGILMAPIYESQTANYMPMMDFELFDRVLSQKNMPKILTDVIRSGEETMTLANTLNDVFKAGALLRLGYTIRNTVEAQLRIASVLGSIGSLRFLGEGTKNFMTNTYKRSGRFIDDVRGVPNKRAIEFVRRSRINSEKEIPKLQERLASLSDNIPEEAAAKEVILKQIAQHEAVLAANAPSREALVLSKIGQGKVNLVSKYTLMDGTETYVFDDAFSGPLAGLREQLVSAESSRIRLINETAEIIGEKMKPVGFGPIDPTKPEYYSEWADTLNKVFRNSQIARRFAAGETYEDVAKWMKSVDGRPVRKMLGLNLNEVDGHLEIAYQMFNDHVPDEVLAKQILTDELFTAAGVKSAMEKASIKNLVPIQGNIIREVYAAESQNTARRLINGAFRFIGTLPEDKLARQPFYIMSYRNALQRTLDKVEYVRFRNAKGGVVERLSEEQLFKIQQAAHREALKEMKKTLFNIERRTNMASAMHLIMPFFSAYENSLKMWSRVAYNKPQIAMRGYYAFTAPNRMGIATDENGNPVPVEKASMDDTIWLSVPSAFTKIPVIGKGLEPFVTREGMRVRPDGTEEKVTVGGFGVAKRSLDVVFGGGLELPIGPYVALPVSQIVKSKPELEDTFKWALPFGPQDPNSILPTWLRRQVQRAQGEDNSTYANFFSMIWQTEMQKYRDGLRPEPKPAEIEKMTQAYFNMHSIANLIMPFAPKFDTPYKFYIDRYREMQQEGFVRLRKEDGTYETVSPQDRFYREFGEDFFGFTSSLSSNTTGSKASVSSVQRAEKYSGLIASLVEDDPKLIGVITDDGKTYEFSKAAYVWQQENAVAPGSKTRFREKGDPIEADRRNRAQLGWIKFNKEKTELDMELAARGLTSYESRYAQDLKARKDQMIRSIESEYPEWYDDYLDTDGSKTRRVIRGLTKVVTNDTFMRDNRNNTTWKSVAVYLATRQQVQELLQYRESKSLDAKSNVDLRMMWDDAVHRLTRGDIGFEDLYNRFLTQDKVWDKVEAYKGTGE